MTGYGQGSDKQPDVLIEVSVRTVNGRYLETRIHCPREYAGFEAEMKKLASSRFRRGTVDIYFSKKAGAKGVTKSLKVQTELARKWLKGYRTLAKSLKVSDEFSLETLVMRENVISFEENLTPTAGEKKVAIRALQAALISCEKERMREGRFLKRDIERLFARLTKLIEKMKRVRVEANRLLGERLKLRWNKMNIPGEIDVQRLAQEVIIQVDKSDISEEITRLGEHVHRMKALCKSPDVIGKKLDFYTQELLREVNTIGSKSALAELTELVVDAKTTVEQIKEQVQNVE